MSVFEYVSHVGEGGYMIYVQSIIVFYIHLGTVERKDFHQLNYRGSFKGGMFMNGGAPFVFLCSGYLFFPLVGFFNGPLHTIEL